MSTTFSVHDLVRRYHCSDESEFRWLVRGTGFPAATHGEGSKSRWSREAVKKHEADAQARIAANPPPAAEPLVLNADFDLDLSALPTLSLADFSI